MKQNTTSQHIDWHVINKSYPPTVEVLVQGSTLITKDGSFQGILSVGDMIFIEVLADKSIK